MSIKSWWQRHMAQTSRGRALDALTREQADALLETLVIAAYANGHLAEDELDRVVDLACRVRPLSVRDRAGIEAEIGRITSRLIGLDAAEVQVAAEEAAREIPRGEAAEALLQMVAAVCFADTAADRYETGVGAAIARGLGLDEAKMWSIFEDLGPASR